MKFVINGLEFRVYKYPNGRWIYVFDDFEGNSSESPIFAKHIKPSLKHFTKWIVSTIQEEEGEE